MINRIVEAHAHGDPFADGADGAAEHEADIELPEAVGRAGLFEGGRIPGRERGQAVGGQGGEQGVGERNGEIAQDGSGTDDLERCHCDPRAAPGGWLRRRDLPKAQCRETAEQHERDKREGGETPGWS